MSTFKERCGFAVGLCLLTSAVQGCLHAERRDLIPREVLLSGAEIGLVRLSPDGSQMVFMRITGSGRSLWLAQTNAPDAAVQIAGRLPGATRDFWWTHTADTLVFQQRVEDGIRLFRIDLVTDKELDLTPIPNARAALVRMSAQTPGSILVDIKGPERSSRGLYRLDLTSGKREVVMKTSAFRRVYVDASFRPRIAERVLPGGDVQLLRVAEDGSHEVLKTLAPDNRFTQGVIGVDADGDAVIFVDRTDRDKSVLWFLDVATGRQSILAEDPNADVRPTAFTNTYTHALYGVSARFPDLRRYHMNSQIGVDFRFLEQHFGSEVGVAGTSADGNTWLVGPFDGGPFRYHVYHRPTRRVTFLFSTHPRLEGRTLARLSSHVIEARDGLQLPCHLYLRPDLDRDDDGLPDAPLPTLLYVHGGPHAAYPWDSWFTNRFLQLLADRGYAVLRVEFRGADGFGKRFRALGRQEWGGRAQDDLVDIARWAVQRGIAQRGKVGVWGWSYGGYAAMASVTFTPDEFACGISLYGVSSLDALVKLLDSEDWRERIGDPRTEQGRAVLSRHSPLDHVERVGKPILMTCGGLDRRVPHDVQSEPFARRLDALGKPGTYLFYPDEPHDYRKKQNWISFWAVAEQFLATHLGGQAEPFGADVPGGSSIEVKIGAGRIPGLVEALARTGDAPR